MTVRIAEWFSNSSSSSPLHDHRIILYLFSIHDRMWTYLVDLYWFFHLCTIYSNSCAPFLSVLWPEQGLMPETSLYVTLIKQNTKKVHNCLDIDWIKVSTQCFILNQYADADQFLLWLYFTGATGGQLPEPCTWYKITNKRRSAAHLENRSQWAATLFYLFLYQFLQSEPRIIEDELGKKWQMCGIQDTARIQYYQNDSQTLVVWLGVGYSPATWTRLASHMLLPSYIRVNRNINIQTENLSTIIILNRAGVFN